MRGKRMMRCFCRDAAVAARRLQSTEFFPAFKAAGGVLDQMMNTGTGELSICGTHVSPLALPKQFSWAQDFAKTIVLKQTMEQTVKPDMEATTNHDMGATTKPELLATVKLAPKLAEVWRCPVCTFANSHLFDKECTMCFYPREDTDVATMEPEQDDGIDAGEV